MTKSSNIVAVTCFALLFLAAVWLVLPVITPFVLSMVFCYILNPIVEKLSSVLRIKRKYSGILVIAIFFIFLIVICFSVIPMIYRQLVVVGSYIPSYNSIMKNQYVSYAITYIGDTFPELGNILKSGIKETMGQFFTISGWLTKGVIKSSMTIFNTISYILIAPFITFFILKDLEKIKSFLNNIIPERYRNEVCEILSDINNALFSYLCGQFYVASILSVYYTIGFYILGVDTKIALGIMSGFSVFVPYLGPVASFITSAIIVVLQIGTLKSFGILVLIFSIGQLLEGMFLTPKLIGDQTGLHPVFIVFFLLLGGNMFGLTGVLLAVPTAAVLMVIGKYLMKKYYKSTFYNLL